MKLDYFSFENLPEKHYNEIVRLLVLTDKDFFPPLSSRTSTTQEHFALEAISQNADRTIYSYFQALLKQCFIIASADNEAKAFLSYKKNHVASDVDVLGKNAYVSTICVDPEYRGIGITSRFYDTLEADKNNQLVYTRTWSENHTHISLLKKREYELILEIADDRAAGISTVYYAKRLDESN
jgi:ribosomal protein S18 acetylase RimI-like enzyme